MKRIFCWMQFENHDKFRRGSHSNSSVFRSFEKWEEHCKHGIRGKIRYYLKIPVRFCWDPSKFSKKILIVLYDVHKHQKSKKRRFKKNINVDPFSLSLFINVWTWKSLSLPLERRLEKTILSWVWWKDWEPTKDWCKIGRAPHSRMTSKYDSLLSMLTRRIWWLYREDKVLEQTFGC